MNEYKRLDILCTRYRRSCLKGHGINQSDQCQWAKGQGSQAAVSVGAYESSSDRYHRTKDNKMLFLLDRTVLKQSQLYQRV